MRKAILVLGFLFITSMMLAQSKASSSSGWQTKVDHELPLLGHRNWILIVDSAYPEQSAPGVETVETGAGQLEVVRYVLGAVGNSIHVRPDILMDAELPYVQEADAPGVTAYRTAIAKVLEGHAVEPVLHERLIANVDHASRLVHILVLKTQATIPYSSVFIRLNCKYWSDEAERRVRARMGGQETSPAPQSEPGPVPGVPPVPQPHPAVPAPPPSGK